MTSRGKLAALARAWAMLLIALPARASGSTAADFLKIDPSPRAESMGGVSAAAFDDVNAQVQNPAVLSGLETPQVSLNRNRHLEGVDESFLAAGFPLGYFFDGWRTSLGFSVTHVQVAPFDAYNEFDLPAGKVSAADLALQLSGAHRIVAGERLALDAGVAIKHLRSRLHDAAASAMAYDLGVGLGWKGERHVKDAQLGASLQNLGSEMKFDQTGAKLPQVLRIGVALSPAALSALRLSVQSDKYVDLGARFGFGVEYRVLKLLALRAGYRLKEDLGSGLSFGMGIGPLPGRISVDYAFAQSGPFRSTHRIGLTYRFPSRQRVDPALNELAVKIRTAIDQGRLFHAREYIERLRALFPQHALLASEQKHFDQRLDQERTLRPDYVQGYEDVVAKRWGGALANLEKALNREKDDEEVREYVDLAKLELTKGKRIEELERKARISVIFELADNARLQGDDKKALKLIEDILRLGPYPPASQLRDQIMAQTRRPARFKPGPAVAIQPGGRKPSAQESERAEALFYQAMQNYAAGNIKEARELLTQAQGLDPSQRDVSSTLERIERELRRMGQ